MKTLLIQPVKTRRQIAEEFQISERTLRRWLKIAGIELPQRLITSKEQEVIYRQFGLPARQGVSIGAKI